MTIVARMSLKNKDVIQQVLKGEYMGITFCGSCVENFVILSPATQISSHPSETHTHTTGLQALPSVKQNKQGARTITRTESRRIPSQVGATNVPGTLQRLINVCFLQVALQLHLSVRTSRIKNIMGQSELKTMPSPRL